MGTATDPVRGSGCWPAWTARVEKPRFFGSPFNANPRFDSCCGERRKPARAAPDAGHSIRSRRPEGTQEKRVRYRHMSDPQFPDAFSPMRWEGPGLQLLEQTRLPTEEVWIDCETPEQVADAIRRLAVRGAPAIGVAAAYGLVLGMRTVRDPGQLRARFKEVSRVCNFHHRDPPCEYTVYPTQKPNTPSRRI